MDRKAIARETLRIMEQGYYERNGQRVDIDNLQKASIEKSFLLTPEEGEVLIKDCETINKQTEKKTVVLEGDYEDLLEGCSCNCHDEIVLEKKGVRLLRRIHK